MTIFEVTNQEIKSLNEEQLHKLLDRLLDVEAAKRNFCIKDFHVAITNTKAQDGGVDGKLDTTTEWEFNGFVTNNKVIFQIKAQSHPESECRKEIEKDSCEPTRIKISEGFHYIVLCNRDECTAETMISERLKGIKDGLKAKGIKYIDNQIHFYDINKIRQWVNDCGTALQGWVKSELGNIIPPGIIPFEKWEEDYVAEERKFFSSEQLQMEIENIGKLIINNKFIRIVGHSGIGKTRRVFESIKSLPEKIKNKVLYCQIQDSREAKLLDFINATSEKDFILVVDDCRQELEQNLRNNLKSDKCTIKLITIDYEIPELDRNPFILEDLDKLHGGNRDNAIIKNILTHKLANTLSIADLEKLVNFSQGYPFLAIKLAEAFNVNDPLIGSLTDDELKRKLLWGREGNSSDKEGKEKMLSICSLFTHLGFDDELGSESQAICKVLGVSFDDFEKAVHYFRSKQKRIIQSRGRYIFVVPLPLATHLALKWFDITRPEKIINFLTSQDIPDEVRNAFCQQMKFLSDNEKVVKVVGNLCDINGPFGHAEVLNSDAGSQCFCNFVEVTPEKAAQTLEHVFKNITIKELKEQWGPGRRNIIRALEKLVFRKETFFKAIRILYKFALAENETWANNATGQFRHLFHLVLSGTEVPAVERLFIIEEAIKSGEKGSNSLAIKALESAFTTSYSRTVGAEYQGGKKALIDWQPTEDTANEYISLCLNYIFDLIQSDSTSIIEKEEAVNVFCGHIRVCIARFGLIDKIENLIVKISSTHSKSNTGILSALSHVLQYDSEKLPQDIIKKVENLVEELLSILSKDLETEFNTFISGEPYKIYNLFQRNQNIDFQVAQQLLEEKSREIAKKYISDDKKIFQSLKYFITVLHKNLNIFGKTIGEEFTDTRQLVDKCFEIYEENPQSDPIFFASVLGGISNKNINLAEEILDEVFEHEVLKKHLIYLTCFVKASKRGLERILKGLREEIITPDNLSSVNLGLVLAGLDEVLVKDFLERILDTKRSGIIAVALGIISSYCWGKKKELISFENIVEKKFVTYEGLLEISKSSKIHEDFYALGEIIKYFINNSSDSQGKKIALIYINNVLKLVTEKNEKIRVRHDTYLKESINITFAKYGDYLWPTIKKIILEADPLQKYLLHEWLGNTFNSYDDKGANSYEPILNISWEIIKLDLNNASASDKEEICDFIVQTVTLLQKDNEGYNWHPWILNIINDYFTDKLSKSLKTNISSYSCWGGSSNYYKKYLKPLKELTTNKNIAVKEWARDSISYIEETIKYQKIREEELNIN